MKLSYDWLCDFAEFPKITFEKILEKINLSICEIDDVEEYRKDLENVVVVKIGSLEKHPDADKLFLTRVMVSGEEKTVVTGATNLQIGDLVPLALPGSFISGKEIKESKLKGISSYGMFCSEADLGLSEDNSGVMKFPKDASIGLNLRKYLEFEDRILVIDNKSITHRPDLWCHFGFARELAAQLDLPILMNPFESKFDFKLSKSTVVKNSKDAHSYFALPIENVDIKPSISRLQNRLTKCGVRTINNVVDVSNYVMLEMGQPTHFFDSDRLGNLEIGIEKLNSPTKLSLLDGTNKDLNSGVLVITNQDKPVAIAGVMGGLDSSVIETTKNLVLESAVFKREDIRASIRATSIRSDASIRYEKGLNPKTPIPVIHRVLNLLKENGGGDFLAGNPNGFSNASDEPVVIRTSFEFLEKKLGKKFPDSEILHILRKLGFEVSVQEDLEIKVPEYRSQYDITIAEDIVEEVGRSLGYAAIDPLPLNAGIEPSVLNPAATLVRRIKHLFSELLGFNEVYNYSFASEKDTIFENPDSPSIKIQNSMPEEYRYLRTSLYPSLLKNVSLNEDRFDKIRIFEQGRSYFKDPNGKDLGSEKKEFVFGVSYLRKKENFLDLEDDLIRVRSELESLLIKLHLPNIQTSHMLKPYLHPGSGISFSIDGTLIAEMGYLHPLLQEEYGIKKRLIIGKIDLETLNPIWTDNRTRYIFQSPSQYPQDSLDISLVLDESTRTEVYSGEVLRKSIPELESISVSSIYRGENIPAGKKSVTYHISLINYKETFTQNRISEITETLLETAREMNYQVR